MERFYGCEPDEPDLRDHQYAPALHAFAAGEIVEDVPSKFDLRDQFREIPIYNQGRLSSCTAHGVAYAYHHAEYKQRLDHIFTPSRMFIYYNTRALNGNEHLNCGASIRDTMKSVNQSGVCTEAYWPYIPRRYDEKPAAECYTQAAGCKIVEYLSVARENLKSVLLEGTPVVFGFVVRTSFDDLRNGKMPVPKPGEASTGNHCVAAIGYDDAIDFGSGVRGGILVRNSWGEVWGDHGYFYMPYVVFNDPKQTHSLWCIRSVTNSEIDDPPVKCCGRCCLC
jgi:C1A family cysteine protease